MPLRQGRDPALELLRTAFAIGQHRIHRQWRVDAIEHAVGLDVGAVQAIGGDHLPVDLGGHRVGVGEPVTQGGAECHVHPALVAGDALAYGRHVFLVALAVTARRGLLVQLVGLECVTGIQLVGDSHRHYAQAGYMLPEGLAGLVAAHAQHFDDRRLSAIHAVLGPTLPLGDPDRRALLQDRVLNVVGQVFRGGQQFPRATDRALDDKALVEPHQVGHPGLGQQVVADGDTHGVAAGAVQRVIGKGRVHGDIPVIAHVQVGLPRIQLLQSRHAETAGGVLNHAVHVALDNHLHGTDVRYAPDLVRQPPAHQRPGQAGGQARQPAQAKPRHGGQELSIGQQPGEDLRDLLIAIGAYLCKWIVQALNLVVKAAHDTQIPCTSHQRRPCPDGRGRGKIHAAGTDGESGFC